MGKVRITCELPDEMCDSESALGLSEEGYGEVMDALDQLGAESVEVRRA